MATQQITGRQIKDSALSNNHISPTAAIASTKLAPWGANRDAGNQRLTNLADGTSATDAVTKQQLEAAITASAAGLAVKAPVRVASTANISGTYTATGGASARGQFTAMPNAVDGVSLAVGNRVLLKNQTTLAQNGIWTVTTLGTGSNGVWDRATDTDGDQEVTDGTAVMVGEGNVNSTTQWVLTTNAPITVGGSSGSALAFAQFGAGQSYTADGTTLTLSSNQFSVTSGGIGATQLGSNAVTTVKILDANVTEAKLATNAVTTAKISDANVTQAKLANGAVGESQLAALAVTTAKLANAAVTDAKLASNSVTTAKILDANVTEAKLANGAVTAAKLAANAVTGGAISFLTQAVTGAVNGSNTNFTMSATPYGDSLIVWVGGVRQRPITDFTFSGTTLTLTTAPETGDDIAIFGVVA